MQTHFSCVVAKVFFVLFYFVFFISLLLFFFTLVFVFCLFAFFFYLFFLFSFFFFLHLPNTNNFQKIFIHGTLTSTTTPGQSGPGSIDIEGLLHTP